MRIVTANKQIDVFDTDIFLVSYPRSGNRWMCWLLTVCIKGHWEINTPGIVNSAIPDIYQVSNNAAQIDAIKTQYGDLLIKLGYEANHDW